MARPRPAGSPTPFSGAGRWRRLLPFWLAGSAGLALAWPPGDAGPGRWLTGVTLCVVIVLCATLLPWQRWHPAWQAVPPLAYYAAVVLLHQPALHDALVVLAVMPVLWLTLHHGWVLQVAGLAGLAVTLAVMVLVMHGDPGATWRGSVAALVLGCLVSVAGYHLLGRLRSARAALAQAHDLLKSDNEFTSAVLDTADCLVIVLDREAVITTFNRRCQELTGLRPEDVVGRSFWDVPLLHPEHHEYSRTVIGSMLLEDFCGQVEVDWLDRDGRPRRIIWSNTLLRDAAGAVTHIVATGLDVADQRRTAHLVEGVLEAATEQAIFAVDVDTVFTLFNVGAQRMLGYTADDVVGRARLTGIHLPQELDARAAELGVPVSGAVVIGTARHGRPETREWTLVGKDGRHVPVSLTVTGLQDDDGRIAGYVGIARDISVERQAAGQLQETLVRERLAHEQLREVDRIRKDFVATVSHELRTPLTSIIGNLEMALEGDVGPLTAAQTRVLAAVDRNARRLHDLVGDLLTLSQIESGRLDPRIARDVPVAATVGQALDTVDQQRAARDIAVRVDVPDGLQVRGDSRQLERVFVNLLGNAVKFTPPGGSVTVAARVVDGYAEISVADTGIGIPADEIGDVFSRFVRSSRSRSQEIQGTGLGLTISKSIVEQHGGTITIAPGEPSGTIVTVRLPHQVGVQPDSRQREPAPQHI
jgi:PAS domain S-box-containing protein